MATSNEPIVSKLQVPVEHIDQKGHDLIWGSASTVKVTRFERVDSSGESRFYYVADVNSSCTRCGKVPHWTWSEESGVLKATVSYPCEVAIIEPYVVRLAVPSGKLVYADYLLEEDTLPERDYETMSLNNAAGRENYAKLLEEFECVFGCVDLRLPRLWINRETNELLVADSAEHEESEEPLPPSAGFELVGDIVDEVWTFQLADFEAFKRIGGIESERVKTLDVIPGIYEFTVENDLDALDSIAPDEPAIYAWARLVEKI